MESTERYTGKITTLVGKRKSGWIEYLEDGEQKRIFFKGCSKSYKLMGGVEVSFVKSVDELGRDIAAEVEYVGNEAYDKFMESDLEKGDIISGRLQEFNHKLYFIDDEYGLVFHVKNDRIMDHSATCSQMNAIIRHKSRLVVRIDEPPVSATYELIKEAYDKGQTVFRAEVIGLNEQVVHLQLTDFPDWTLDISVNKLPGYEIGDLVYLRLTSPTNMKFCVV